MRRPNVTYSHRHRVLAAVLALIALLLPVATSFAHGFSSVVYVDATSPGKGHVQTVLGLEYDLLIVSAADAQHDDPLFRAGTAAFNDGDSGEQAAAVESHAATVMAYVTKRFGVTDGGAACSATKHGKVTIAQRVGVPYAFLTLDFACARQGEDHIIHSGLFPDAEGYVKGTKTIVTYDHLDLRSGSASLDSKHPSFSTHQSLLQRYEEFFRLGANHLLTGLDHILFLLALIAGSRRLREIVLAASTFTLAHSVTFILAALDLVHVPSWFVEPVIALSIAIVAGLHLIRIWLKREDATELDTRGHGLLGLDAAGRARLVVVFCFGLIHGLGFADALGIDQAFSWKLLSSLLVFNVGIETVQLGIILAVFPILALIRRRAPLAGLTTTGTIAAAVSAAGLFWFVERAFSL
jgi:hypothetical protein